MGLLVVVGAVLVFLLAVVVSCTATVVLLVLELLLLECVQTVAWPRHLQAWQQQAKIKRFFKESIYNRLPFEISAFAYFLFRYVVQLGFLDGREGFTYHVLQGFWYRFLVGAKLLELERAVKRATSEDELRSEIARLTRQKVSLRSGTQ